MEDRVADQLKYSIVLPKGNIVPSTKAVTIFRPGTFTFDVLYADPSQVQAPQRISSYTMIEEDEVEVIVTTVAMETDDGQSNGVSEVGENVDVNMQETKNSSEHSSARTTSENGASEMQDKTAQMETEAK
ncbi:hypothetical protein KI387_032410, partial [Taxus chinensis]